MSQNFLILIAIVDITTGNSQDWTYDVAKIKYSYGFGLRDTGLYGKPTLTALCNFWKNSFTICFQDFYAPPSEIKPTALKFFELVKALAKVLISDN